MKVTICSRRDIETLTVRGEFPPNTAVISFYDSPDKRMRSAHYTVNLLNAEGGGDERELSQNLGESNFTAVREPKGGRTRAAAQSPGSREPQVKKINK